MSNTSWLVVLLASAALVVAAAEPSPQTSSALRYQKLSPDEFATLKAKISADKLASGREVFYPHETYALFPERFPSYQRQQAEFAAWASLTPEQRCTLKLSRIRRVLDNESLSSEQRDFLKGLYGELTPEYFGPQDDLKRESWRRIRADGVRLFGEQKVDQWIISLPVDEISTLVSIGDLLLPLEQLCGCPVCLRLRKK